MKQIKNNLLNIFYDYLYTGCYLGKVCNSRYKGAYAVESTDYVILENIFKNISIKNDDVLVDVGCGKGRVIAWWLKKLRLNNNIIGIEVNSNISSFTNQVFKNFRNISIINDDVTKSFPKNGTIFYLFNPFEPYVLKLFKEKLDSLETKTITVIYYHYPNLDIFINDIAWKTELKVINRPDLNIEKEPYAIITRDL